MNLRPTVVGCAGDSYEGGIPQQSSEFNQVPLSSKRAGLVAVLIQFRRMSFEETRETRVYERVRSGRIPP